MSKKKLLDDIKARPSRFYRLPGDVIRDRRFGDADRLDILRAWAGDTEANGVKPQVEAAIEELETRMPAPTYAGGTGE